MLLLHFLYLCYSLNCSVTSHVSKDTCFIRCTYQMLLREFICNCAVNAAIRRFAESKLKDSGK